MAVETGRSGGHSDRLCPSPTYPIVRYPSDSDCPQQPPSLGGRGRPSKGRRIPSDARRQCERKGPRRRNAVARGDPRTKPGGGGTPVGPRRQRERKGQGLPHATLLGGQPEEPGDRRTPARTRSQSTSEAEGRQNSPRSAARARRHREESRSRKGRAPSWSRLARMCRPAGWARGTPAVCTQAIE